MGSPLLVTSLSLLRRALIRRLFFLFFRALFLFFLLRSFRSFRFLFFLLRDFVSFWPRLPFSTVARWLSSRDDVTPPVDDVMPFGDVTTSDDVLFPRGASPVEAQRGQQAPGERTR